MLKWPEGFIYFLQRPAWKSRQDFQSPHAAAAAEVALHGLSPEDRRYACANACACAFIKQNQNSTRAGHGPDGTKLPEATGFIRFFFLTFLGEWIMNGMSEFGFISGNFQIDQQVDSFFAEYLTLAMEVYATVLGFQEQRFGTCGRPPSVTHSKLPSSGLLGGSGVSWAWWLGASGWKTMKLKPSDWRMP